MDKSIFKFQKKSFIEIGSIYFWTATINQWINSLKRDDYKEVILDSLKYLSALKKIDVFAFIIMPNHIHIIWRINEMNGKEMPHASFLKYTAHQFKKLLLNTEPFLLSRFKVNSVNKKYEFWQGDSLAIQLYSEEVVYQKLNYIHNNPTTERWNLVKEPVDYQYSSASFYEFNSSKFGFLKNIWEEY
jgi:REP element-mobilizing transposase RayT